MYLKAVYIVSLIVVLWSTKSSNAQISKDTLLVNYLGQDKGLLQLNTNALTYDTYNFLWVGTDNGLHRFDGYSFKSFTAKPSDSTALLEDHINGLYAHQDTLWIASKTKGILGYDLKKDTFFSWNINEEDDDFLMSYGIFPIDEQHLIFSYKNHFVIHNTITNKDKVVALPNNTVENRVTDALKTENTIFLSTSASSLLSYNLTTQEVKSIVLDGIEDVTQIEKQKDFFLIGSSFALYQVDKEFKNTSIVIDSVAIRHIAPQNDDSFLVASQTRLFSLKENDSLTEFVVKDEERTIYNPLVVNEIINDSQGNYWLGTEGDGLLHYNKNQKLFSTTRLKFDVLENVDKIGVYPFLKTQDSILWIATTFGTVKYNLNSNSNKIYIPQNYNVIYDLDIDKNGTLWAGGISDGLLKYNEEQDKFKQYLKSVNSPDILPNNHILEIIPLPNGNLWLCTESGGIAEFNPKSETYKIITINGKPVNNVRTSFQDSNNNIWLGTDEGLLKLSSKFKLIKEYNSTAPNNLKLSSNSVYGIQEDSKGYIWVGTSSGLTRIEPNTHETKRINKQKDFPNDFIYALLIDNQDNIWASTNMGIVVYNPNDESFKNYTSKDGLQNNEFNLKSAYKDDEGYFYFGGIDGFNRFKPEDIIDNTYSPNVYLTSVELFNNEIGAHTLHLDSLSFMSNENVITFNYSSLSFLNPEKTFYRYKLDGFDPNWSPATQRKSTTYTNLSPGTYKLNISASQKTGVWGAPKQLTLIIRPQWFETLWFKIALAFTILGSALFYYFYKTRALKRDKIKLEGIVADRTQDLVEKNKDLEDAYILTSKQKDNISFLMKELNHRVKNNLQIISSLLNIQSKTVSTEAKDSLKIAKNRILTIAYIQNELETDQKQIDVKAFMERFCEKIIQLMRYDHLMKFEVEYDLEDTGECEINIMLFGLIINELITNTFKYAFVEYNEQNSLKISCKREHNTLITTLEDNGKGYDSSNIKGSSLGVGLVTDMIKQMKGTLKIESKNGVKNTIILNL